DASRVRADPTDARRVGYDIALRFSNGDPAIVTQSLGRGRCVLVTTSLDETWGEWAIWAAGFVPLIHELTEYAATGRSQPRELLVGEFDQREVPNGSTSVTLTTPDGVARTLTPVDRDGRSLIAINDTLHPGNYTLTSGVASATTERFAINVDPRESDPRRLDPREWSTSQSSEQSNGIIVRNANMPAAAPSDGSEPDTHSLTISLLAAVLALLLIEQALAWRFTVGAVFATLSLALAAIWTAMRFL
ncbi:MAG: hypothetical protein IAG10_10120, partial [Planctomycetaceae bacterium]|nr:hypothetical protein [Planctomycetaceae bacterium]